VLLNTGGTSVRYEERLLEYGQKDALAFYLNGHGGDHIFLANPTWACVLAAPRGQRHATLQRLAALQCLPYPLALAQWARMWLRQICHRADEPTYWQRMKEFSTQSWLSLALAQMAKKVQSYRDLLAFDRLTPIEQVRCRLFYQLAQELSHPRLRDRHAQLLFPFFDEALIRAANALPAWQGFNAQGSRQLLRQALNARYHEPGLSRQSKGHTTASVLRSLQRQHAAVAERLREGYLVKSGMVQWRELEHDLRRQCLGIGGVSPAVMHALAIEVFIHRARQEVE